MAPAELHNAPAWLTTDYIENVLRKHNCDPTLRVLRLDVRPATAKGENYASVLNRIKVDYQLGTDQTVHTGAYIVKSAHEGDPYITKIMSPYQMDQTEMQIYDKILPQLTALLGEAGDLDRLFADTINVDYDNSIIIFEDLSVLNFTVGDRIAGMDMEHTKLSLRKLAKMHATAAVLNERCPGLLTKFDHGIFNRHTRGFAPFFENMIGICAKFAGNCPELGAYYKEKLLKLQPYVVEYATRVHDVNNANFNTLNHGDFWINNVMLQYNNNGGGGDGVTAQRTLQDLLIIDFQFCNWGSPATDLHYFLNTSLESELRLHEQDTLVQYYHTILKDTLERLQYTRHIPTLHELWVQIEVGRFYAVTSALVVQSMMINDKTDDADFNGLMKDDERGRRFRDLLYTNKVVQENAKALLPFFDRRGLLDVVD